MGTPAQLRHARKRKASQACELPGVAFEKRQLLSSDTVTNGLHHSCQTANERVHFHGPMSPSKDDKEKRKLFQYSDTDLLSDELFCEMEENGVCHLTELSPSSYRATCSSAPMSASPTDRLNQQVPIQPGDIHLSSTNVAICSRSTPTHHASSRVSPQTHHSQVCMTSSTTSRTPTHTQRNRTTRLTQGRSPSNPQHRVDMPPNRRPRARQGFPLRQVDDAIAKADASTAVKLQSAIKFNGGGNCLGTTRIQCNWPGKAAASDDKPRSDTKVVELTNGTSEDGQEKINETAPENNSQCTTVYVGNLPPEVTSGDLDCHFHALGAGVIEDLHIQRGKGFGFIRYNSHAEAARPIQLGNAFSFHKIQLPC